MIILGVGGGVIQAANPAAVEIKRFDAIIKYFDYSSTGKVKFCQFGQIKPKIKFNC